MARPTLPDTAGAGDAGHVTDHNTMVATLTELYAENPGGTSLAPLASPAFTGNPTAPTPAAGDNDTSIATTAFVRANTVRITRPNTDDRLVEVWNGSAWSVVEYDSGWRDVSSLLINSWTAPVMRLRRIGSDVYLEMYGATGSSSATAAMFALPAGFRIPLSALRGGRSSARTPSRESRHGWSATMSPQTHTQESSTGLRGPRVMPSLEPRIG